MLRFTFPARSPVSRRLFSTTRAVDTNIAIAGGGAAGFYTAARLLAKAPDTQIDIFERLPTPHGTSSLRKWRPNKNVRYFGNVKLGRDIQLDELKNTYDGVVLAYGASQDKKLGIPGEDGIEGSDGVLAAREFVGWDLQPDLNSLETVVVIGHGNVALDCARILLTDPEVLAQTDITYNALEALRKSSVTNVVMVGRRGPLQASFTIKELREMTKIPGLEIITDVPLIKRECEQNKELLAKSRPLKRMMDLLIKHGRTLPSGDQKKTLRLEFLRSPTKVVYNAINSDDGQIEYPQAILLNHNTLEGPAESARAVPTDRTTVVPCCMVLRSIGYASTPVEGAPFDSAKKIVPNISGRVVDGEDVVPGLYVSGWVKRGPVGVIATTMQDAYHTADTIVMDINNKNIPDGKCSREQIDAVLEKVKGQRVSNDDWRRLEEYEFAAGKEIGKPREKVTRVEDMLQIIRENEGKTKKRRTAC
ncbi:FAD/NAD(P)-binding domain-containing protein [Linderina pennispora]|uniref:NADPH:adrenodoxin oxidoreductase, mitochondrial n=1 Tax=Linderina pennispora TaxID=61395 RepID=A0A1Y1W221_9FUNG|nr:FAD/NAD(P)-binding domain-containing protein [Linderina pennispora]ORX67527.1 FAD/NAD(P)-binding domain-containing protein [Linderina pennispora]